MLFLYFIFIFVPFSRKKFFAFRIVAWLFLTLIAHPLLLYKQFLLLQCGEGGALVNLSGEVIGITFYYDYGFTTPFMPINIARKCWEHYKRYGYVNVVFINLSLLFILINRLLFSCSPVSISIR